jgi:hypothetical protein
MPRTTRGRSGCPPVTATGQSTNVKVAVGNPLDETTGKGIVTTIIVACIFFCIPTPWPVL